MEHFVTLFDSLFLPQGLALHRSLERHAGAYTLWVLCVDDGVFAALNEIGLPNVRLIDLRVVETQELVALKQSRSKGEYCWTLTPFAPRFVFEADLSVERVTYIDADVWLRKSPVPIFKEFSASGKQVLITDHAYAPEYDFSAGSGQYCVQFMIFTRSGGEAVRQWWEDRCVEWCFARYEDGKFGDQKYLDCWPEKFPDLVHVMQNKEWALAPWNATRFPLSGSIFWHFQGLRLYLSRGNGVKVDCGNYPLPKVVIAGVYEPYMEDLGYALRLMDEFGIPVRPQKVRSSSDIFLMLLRGVWQQLWQFRKINTLSFKHGR